MTFLQLKTLLVGWLDDLNYGYFTEAQVETWLNLAQTKVQTRLLKAGQNFYAKKAQTTLVVNRREYILPGDFREEHRIEVVLSGTTPNECVSPINPMTLNQSNTIGTGTGTPCAYYFKRNRLIVYPAPDAALVLRMDYSPLVAGMALATDLPDVPEQYHEYLALVAAETAYLKDGRMPDMLNKMKAEYEEALDESAAQRNLDQSRMVKMTGNFESDSGGW